VYTELTHDRDLFYHPERARTAAAKEKPGSDTNRNVNLPSQQLVIPDETILSRLVAARLDLPVSQSLLHEFKLSIIKRCWEDQLRLKRKQQTNVIHLITGLFS
jgi:hypothetical protein